MLDSIKMLLKRKKANSLSWWKEGPKYAGTLIVTSGSQNIMHRWKFSAFHSMFRGGIKYKSWHWGLGPRHWSAARLSSSDAVSAELQGRAAWCLVVKRSSTAASDTQYRERCTNIWLDGQWRFWTHLITCFVFLSVSMWYVTVSVQCRLKEVP